MNKVVLAVCMLMIGLVVLFGLYLFLKGARNVQLAVVSTRWPTTSGRAVSSQTTRDASPDTRTSPSTVTFDTRTVIHYAVNGRDYTTDILHFGQTLGSGDKSEAALQRLRYPAGKDVTVSYNPASPSTAVMKPGLHAEAFWLPGAGLAFLLPAALCMFMLPAMLRSSTADDQAFANYVHAAIETGRPNSPPPPRQSGDSIMAVGGTVFGAILCGLGMLLLTSGLQRAWRGSASTSWPTTHGVVLSAGADEPDDTTDAAYRARLIYQYQVAGMTHFNNLRTFAQVEGGATYHRGAGVKVSYFPSDPDVAVLEPGNTSDALWLPGIGVFLLLASLAIFIWLVPALSKPVGG